MDATTTTTNSASSLGDIGEQKPAQQADFCWELYFVGCFFV
jgi:hypothetical protein